MVSLETKAFLYLGENNFFSNATCLVAGSVADRRGSVFESRDIGRLYSASKASALPAGSTSRRNHLGKGKKLGRRSGLAVVPAAQYNRSAKRNKNPTLGGANEARNSWSRDAQSSTASVPSIH
ncbi:hypothetical protein DPMN_095159 [Dreissena polymorpha]|uniref:Uncharacterized protein n=1 Tax=Dreissena polymorpha TaxID=45954 RepID=A0A9D4R2G9_DREPO|nr:hypothetical protein DPMN_095159 [Dreissena polymorpha]